MPDEYRFRYSCSEELSADRSSMVAFLRDLFYGQAFRLYEDREEVVALTHETFDDCVAQVGVRDERQHFTVSIPESQFPDGSITAILNQVWGNPLDYGDFRLERIDPRLTRSLRAHRSVPLLSQMSQQGRPLLAMVLKPSWKLSLQERIKIATTFVALGGDMVKEDETYFPDPERMIDESTSIQRALSAVDSAERGLGVYVPHISGVALRDGVLNELEDSGVQAAMLSFVTGGLGFVHAISKKTSLFLWGHRVGYAAIQETLGMEALIQLAWSAGLNAVHLGTPLLSDPLSVDRFHESATLIDSLDAKGEMEMWPILSKITTEIGGRLIEKLGRQTILLGCGAFLGTSGVNVVAMKDWIRILRELGK